MACEKREIKFSYESFLDFYLNIYVAIHIYL